MSEEKNNKNHLVVRDFIFEYLTNLKWIIFILAAIFALACTLYILTGSNSWWQYLSIYFCIVSLLCIILSLIIIFSIVNSLKYEWRNMLELDAINEFEKNKFNPLKDEVKELKSILDDTTMSKLKNVDKTELLNKIDELLK